MSNGTIECTHRPWQNYYVKGTKPVLEAFEFQNIPHLMEEVSRKWSHQKAFTLCLPNGMSQALSFHDVDQTSNWFAAYLETIVGLKAGDRVAIQMPNCLAYPVAVFGALKAGGVIVNTNPLYTPYEMQHQFADSGAKVLIILDMFAHKLKDILPQTQIEHVVVASLADFFPFIQKTIIHNMLKYVKKQIPQWDIKATPFHEALSVGKNEAQKKQNIGSLPIWKSLTPNSLCILQYTGGTTGVSKGAMLSHGNLMSNISQIIEMGKSKITFGQENMLTALPLYHIFAFTVNLLTFYAVGGHSILIPNPRPLTNMQRAFAMYPITWISGVNTLFNGLLNEEWFSNNPPKHLKAAIAGGTSLHKAVAERWLQVTKTQVVEGFGLTEASPVVSFNPLCGQVKAETVGIPVPSTDVVLLDEQGVPVPIGEVGEIAIQGPQVMLGYWLRPDETAKTMRGSWLLTGDIGVMDAQGYLKIVDRKKDMILVSGFNVYPNEVEDCIARLEGVKEVAVIGVANDKSGEVVKAFVVKKDANISEQVIIDHCKKFLTSYKIPKIIEFRTDLPKTPIGKILRKELRGEQGAPT